MAKIIKYRRKKRIYKRKYIKAKTKYGYNKPTAIFGPSVVPNQMMTKCRYYTGNVGSTTTLSPGAHVFAINNMWDPDDTGTGHSVFGFTQYKQFYGRFRVWGVLLEVRFANLTAGSSSVVGILPMPSSSSGATPTTLKGLCENRRAKVTTVPAESSRTLKVYLRPYVVEGVSRQEYTESIYAHSGTGPPATEIYAALFWQNADEASSTGHHVTAVCTYYVMCDVPKILAPS